MILIFEFAFDPMVWHFLVCIVRNLYRFTVGNGLLVDIKTNTIALFEKAARRIQSLLHYIENAQENKKNTIVSYNKAENSKRIKRNEEKVCVCVFGCWMVFG
jgi:hypothetical protein